MVRQNDLSATVRSRVIQCVAPMGRDRRGRQGCKVHWSCDVTYKVATHRRAVNATRAYCLRSRDEPFSRARLAAAARLTGRGAVNRTLWGGSGGNR